jgi:hypothetical protein
VLVFENTINGIFNAETQQTGEAQMYLNEISNKRLVSQKIAATEFKTASEIVSWMGAMQAQDFSMAKLAVGTRISDSTDKSVEAFFNTGEILRTHLMRPTWHFVAAEDIHWLLGLTAPKIKSLLKSRNKELELSEAIFAKSNIIIEKSLSGGFSKSRDELAKEFNGVGIRTDFNRLSHLLLNAELDGLICSGPIRDKKQTFSLLRERVPLKKMLSREESLFELADRYFRSHSPATLQDFTWWSGLSAKEARQAMESVKHNFVIEIFESGEYLFPASQTFAKHEISSVHLLPAYDEFLISYRDRGASLRLADHRKAVSVNGIFYPVVVVDGQVAGLWSRSVKNNKVVVEVKMFTGTSKAKRELIDKKAAILGKFLNKETIVSLK